MQKQQHTCRSLQVETRSPFMMAFLAIWHGLMEMRRKQGTISSIHSVAIATPNTH